MLTDVPEEHRFREKTRAPLAVPLRLQFDSFADPEHGFTADVSEGGMFVTLKDPRPVGTRVRFWLNVPDEGEPVCGLGEVVWMRLIRAGSKLPSGMGIEFRYLADQDRERIHTEIERIIKEQALPREPSLSEEAALKARRAASVDDRV